MKGFQSKKTIVKFSNQNCLVKYRCTFVMQSRQHQSSAAQMAITKTCLYNFDPLQPHFYMVKLGFTGVYIIFLISAQKHRLWVLVRVLGEAVLTSTHNLCFEQKYEKYQNFYLKIFLFLVVKFSIYLNRRVFVMPSI